MSDELNESLTPRTFVDSMIRVGLISLLAAGCFWVFSPFVGIMAWGVLLAIMLYPLHQGLAKRLGGRQGMTSVLMVLVVGSLVIPLLVFVAGAFVTEAKDIKTDYQNGAIAIPQPAPEVADWPVIGERLHKLWAAAADDLPAFAEEHAEQLSKVLGMLTDTASGALGAVFLLLAAFVIASIIMVFGKSGAGAVNRIFLRVAGPAQGPALQSLTVGTVRSVAVGVLGVAFIQALLFGVGFVLTSIPLAGLWTFIVLFIGIMQLPVTVVAIPCVIYLWAGPEHSVVFNVVFTIYFVVAGLADNVLKPILLGRSVDAPMPVILLGAMGGMVSGGFMGLFVGAVLLAVGYRIFMQWVDREPEVVAP